MLRLLDTILLRIGRRGSRARGRLAYRMLVTLAAPERPTRPERYAASRKYAMRMASTSWPPRS